MAREMLTKRVIINKPGTLSDCLHTRVKVYFDLIETQDIVDGVPDLEFGFGDLRFGDEVRPRILLLARSHTPLVLAGGGIKTTILLSGPNAFIIVGVIKEIRADKADILA
jgi:hypothetical protein